MTENEFKKEVLDDVKGVDESQIEMQDDQQPQAVGVAQDVEQPQQQAMNLMDFGGLITNIYCGLSDVVYKRVKHTETAPAWGAETKQAINEALAAYLSTVNIAVKPIYALVGTLVTVEAMRYLKPMQLPINE